MNYKNIYKKLLAQLGGKTKEKFLIIHNTNNESNLFDILNDGILKPLNELDSSKGQLGKNKDSNLIYTITYFYDLKNLTHLWDYCLIFSSDLFYDYNTWFNNSWQGGILKSSLTTKNINKIKQRIKNPKVNKKLQNLIKDSHLNHELIFNKNIPLDKYLIGVICNECDKKHLQKLTNVPIFTTNLIPKL